MKRLAAIVTLLLVLANAWAQDTSSQRSLKARLEKEIALIEQQIKENSGKNANALNSLSLVRRKMSAREALVRESDAQIKALDDSIRVRQDKVDALQARLDTMSLYYNRLVRNAYKNRDARVWYMYILSSSNIGQASRRYGYLRRLSGQMNTQARKIQDTKAELDSQLVVLKDMRARSEKLRAARRRDVEALRGEKTQTEKLIAQLGREKTKYEKELRAKRQKIVALNREIQKLISGTTKATTKVDTKLAGEFEANRGKLPWPCEGTVLEGFGQHNHPVYSNVVMPFNNGVNIGVAKGTQARAVFNGEVRKIIVMPGYNKCVLVQHGSYFTFYCKLASVDVKAGDKVRTGQVIGVVDTIDGQTQMHFQLWKGTTPQDPELWLR